VTVNDSNDLRTGPWPGVLRGFKPVIHYSPRNAIFTPPHQDYTGLLFSSEPQMDPDWLDRLLASRALPSSNSTLVNV